MDFIPKAMKHKPAVLLVYTQRLVKGRTFEMIGNLGLLTLAAELNAHGFAAQVYTGITTDVVKMIEARKDCLFAVCFYCDFDNQSAVAALISQLKAHYDFYVVLGGPQTLHMTEQALKTYQADAILKGEGEESLLAWLSAKAEGREAVVQGEIRRGETADYVYLEDLAKYQWPRNEAVLAYEARPLLSVSTARGCPYRCAFCFEGGNSKNLRMRRVEDVLNEIAERLRNSRQPRYLFFTDDTLTTNPARMKKLLAGLKALRQQHDFVWFCEGHPGFLAKHPELIREMIDSGMVRMQIGMESGMEEVLAAYNKQAKPADIKKVVEICYQEGLPQLTGNYIIGGAFETAETLETTTAAVMELLDMAPGMLDLSTTFIMPLPGTEIYRHPEDFAIVLEDREYITSIEDFPVNHTVGLSLPEICRGRSQFIARVSQKMKQQYQAGLIPRARIREDFRLALRYGIAGGYFKFIYARNPQLFRYYSTLITYEGQLTEWHELTEAERATWIVQKVQDFSTVDSRTLSQTELDILRHSGRFTLAEIAEKLKLPNLTAIAAQMSERHLLLFSPVI